MSLGSAKRTPWTAKGDEKRKAVRQIFADIAPRYDLLNGLLSVSLHHRWRRAAVRSLGLKGGETALDVCCGTGDFMQPLLQAVGASGAVLGMDFCPPMLEVARKKGLSRLSVGDACVLPYRSESFDAVTVGWGLRNVSDLQAALAEIFRVLKPGSRMVSLDMCLPTDPLRRGVSRFVFRRVIPALGSVFGQREAYTYLPESSERFLTPEGLGAALRAIGFEDVKIRRMMAGHIAMVGGRRP